MVDNTGGKDLKREVIEKNKNVDKIEVIIEKEELEKSIDKEVSKFQKSYQIPGFRKGKAPRNVVKKMLNEEALKAGAVEDALKGVIDEIYDENVMVCSPEISSIGFEDDGSAKVKISVHKKPEITLPDFKDIIVEKFIPSDENIDKMVDERIEQLREENAILEPKNEPVAIGDNVKMTYRVLNAEGKEIYDSKERDYIIYDDDKRPLIEESIGKKSGDKFSFTREFEKPEEDKVSYTYEVEISEVYSRIIPEVDDAFAAEAFEGISTVDELREKIAEESKQAFEDTMQNILKNQVLDGLVRDVDMDVEDSSLERLVEESISTLKEKKEYDKALQEEGGEEELHEKLMDININSLKLTYAVALISDEMKLEISEEMIEEFAGKMAPSWGMEAEKAKVLALKNPNLKKEIEWEISKDKVAEYLLDKVTVEEKALPNKDENSMDEIVDKVVEAVENIEEENTEKSE